MRKCIVKGGGWTQKTRVDFKRLERHHSFMSHALTPSPLHHLRWNVVIVYPGLKKTRVLLKEVKSVNERGFVSKYLICALFLLTATNICHDLFMLFFQFPPCREWFVIRLQTPWTCNIYLSDRHVLGQLEIINGRTKKVVISTRFVFIASKLVFITVSLCLHFIGS